MFTPKTEAHAVAESPAGDSATVFRKLPLSMKNILFYLIVILSLPAIHADNIDDALVRADKLIETDPFRSLELCDSISKEKLSSRQKGILYHIIGNSYFAQGETDNAISAFSTSVKAATDAGDSVTLASVLSDMGYPTVFPRDRIPHSSFITEHWRYLRKSMPRKKRLFF